MPRIDFLRFLFATLYQFHLLLYLLLLLYWKSNRISFGHFLKNNWNNAIFSLPNNKNKRVETIGLKEVNNCRRVTITYMHNACNKLSIYSIRKVLWNGVAFSEIVHCRHVKMYKANRRNCPQNELPQLKARKRKSQLTRNLKSIVLLMHFKGMCQTILWHAFWISTFIYYIRWMGQ